LYCKRFSTRISAKLPRNPDANPEKTVRSEAVEQGTRPGTNKSQHVMETLKPSAIRAGKPEAGLEIATA
jgi:hypothetical protein